MSGGKIGFINLCHEDYIDANVTGMAARAARELETRGVRLLVPEQPAASWSSARTAGERLVRDGADGVILFLGSWIECATAMALVREVEHLPLCMWGFPMFEQGGALTGTGSYVSYAMFRGTLERAGYHFEGILGMPDDDMAIKKAADFSAAAIAASRLKRARVGLVGYTSMSIYPGTFDHLLMRTRIGPEIVHSDSYTLIAEAERMLKDSDAAVGAAERRIRELGVIHDDVRPQALTKSAALLAALRSMCTRDGLDAVNVKCQYEFSKHYGHVPCVPLSALADDGVTAGCEGDILCTVSQLMLRELTGGVAAYGDAITHSGDVVKFSACGIMPFSMGSGARTVRSFMPHPGFSGIQASFVMRPETVTFLRLVEDIGRYHIIYGAGEGLPTGLRQGYMPALDVRVRDMDKLAAHYSGQHFALCYGDCRGGLAALAHTLGVAAVEI